MLNHEQMETLRAVVERVVPADDFLSGWDAGVGDYLVRQLETDLEPYAEVYRLWLDALNAEARAITGLDFVILDAAVQDSLLEAIDAGNVTVLWSVDPVAGFGAIIGHVMEGYYGDPGTGGNRHGIAWRMIGFEVRG